MLNAMMWNDISFSRGRCTQYFVLKTFLYSRNPTPGDLSKLFDIDHFAESQRVNATDDTASDNYNV